MVTAQGFFVGQEEGGGHPRALQNISDAFGLGHAAGVEGQVDRALACTPQARGAASSITNVSRARTGSAPRRTGVEINTVGRMADGNGMEDFFGQHVHHDYLFGPT